MRFPYGLFLAAISLGLPANCLGAGPSIAYELSIGPGGLGINTPRFVLVNRSDVVEITRIAVTIGDTRRNYDIVNLLPTLSAPEVKTRLDNPDALDGAIRSDVADIALASLGPGRSVAFDADIDADAGNSNEDFRTVLFNNGALPNATILIEFGDGSRLSQELPDVSNPGETFSYSQSAPQLTRNYTVETMAGGAIPQDNVPARLTPLDGGVAAVVADTGGNVYFSSGYFLFRIDPNGLLTRIAGAGVPGFSGDGGPALNAQLGGYSNALALDSAGNLYIADNSRVRRISNGIITTIAGDGRTGFAVENGPALQARFNRIRGLAVDSNGNVYIADLMNHRIRMISGGTITTVAGTGRRGFSGDDGPARSADLSDPWGITVDANGNVYFVDSGNFRVRRLSRNQITTVFGNGRTVVGTHVVLDSDGSLILCGPKRVVNGMMTQIGSLPCAGLATDGRGSIYTTDLVNGRLWKIDRTGSAVIAGGLPSVIGDDGPPTRALLNLPRGIALSRDGAISVADMVNNRVRRIQSGIISTVAGTGVRGFSGDGGTPRAAQLDFPDGLAVSPDGSIYVVDTENHRIRQIGPGNVIQTVTRTLQSKSCASFAGNEHFRSGIALDSRGDLYFTDCAQVMKWSGGALTVVAGNGTIGSGGDDGRAADAQLRAPKGLAFDAEGNLLIADWADHRIRKVSNGIITTVAGTGSPGSFGDGGPAVSAQLEYPRSLAVDSSGAIFVSQATGNTPDAVNVELGVALTDGRVRKIQHGVISTIAGNGTWGFSGDGGPAKLALFNSVFGLAAGPNGALYATDGRNGRVRKLELVGPPCQVRAEPLATPVAAAGGSIRVAVSAGEGCPWAIESWPPWMSYSGDRVFNSPAVISFSAAPNLGPRREAAIALAGTAYRVAQAHVPLDLAGITLPFRSTLASPPEFAPGQVINIEGGGLCPWEESATPPLPDQLGGCRVLLDGARIPLQSASWSRIRAVLPQDLSSGVHQLSVERFADRDYAEVLLRSSPSELTVVPIALAFLEVLDGDRQILAVEFDDGQLAGAARPVRPGDQVTLRLTGLGKKEQVYPDGTLPSGPAPALTPPRILVEGVEAKILFAGSDGGNVGMDIIRLELPAYSLGEGRETVSIEIQAGGTGQASRFEVPSVR